MRPGELLSRVAWRLGPVLLIVWAVRSGVIDFKKYLALASGGTKSPAEVQLDKVSDLLVQEYKRTRMLPEGYRLAFWLTQHPDAKSFAARPDVDPFGNSLRLTRIPDGFILSSDGPDKKPKTPDDMAKRVEGLAKMEVLE